MNVLASEGIGQRTTGLAILAVVMCAAALSASAQSTPAPHSEASSSLSARELAKEISNPVTGIWLLQSQFNNVILESENFSPVSGEWVNNLYFQPVLPVTLTKG